MGDQTSNTGGMSPTQMMYAMALMNSGNQSQGSGMYGGASNAVSPIIRAMLLNRMMSAGSTGTGQQAQQMTGYAPSMQPGQSGTGGFVAPYGPSSQGYSQSGAGAVGGNAPLASANPYVAPATAGVASSGISGGGVGASPGVSTVSNPFGSYGYGYSNPYGMASTVPSY